MAISQIVKRARHDCKSKANDRIRSIRLINFETGEYATIMPNLGGTVLELHLKTKKGLLSILESPRSFQEIIENKHYHASKLMPFPGRIPLGKYIFNGKAHKLSVNTRDRAFSIHGFVCQKPFRIVQTTVNRRQASVVLAFIHQGDTPGYPFRFSVRLTYTLTGRSFRCTTVIRNNDRLPIPIGHGWHPYYKTTGSIRRLHLCLPPHSIVKITGEKVPSGQLKKPVETTDIIPLGRKNLDAVFDLGEKRKQVTTRLIDPKLGVEFHIWQDAGIGRYRYLVLYRPASGSSVAVEPWTSAPNAVNNKMGLIVLKPGGRFRASYGVTLKSAR